MDFWDVYSDEDEEIIEFLSRPLVVREVNTRTNFYITLSDKKFKRRFRLTKATTAILLDQITSKLKFKSGRNNAVSPMNQLLCTLRFYATGSQLITCGDFIGIDESTACRVVHRVTHAIASLYHKYIRFPQSAEDQQKIAAGFYKIAKFPRVNGAIDCTHVRLLSPGGDNAEIYRNRKGYFSINTQCVCAANLIFLDVVARWHGSAHDSNIWDNSALKRNFLQGRYNDKLLLGDSGYAQTAYMMTPLAESNILTRGASLYQESQIKSRNVIERCFGIWKRRFPILSRGISVHLHRVPAIIVATAVLHNLAIQQRDSVPCEDPEYPMLVEDRTAPQPVRAQAQQQQGHNMRNLERTLLIEEYFERNKLSSQSHQSQVNRKAIKIQIGLKGYKPYGLYPHFTTLAAAYTTT